MSLPTETQPLPQLTSPLSIGDGGLETTLIFHYGLDLPDFAAFPLLDDEVGRRALRRYYEPYLDLAQRLGVGMVLGTPTWRASADWGQRLGYDARRLADINRRSVGFVAGMATDRGDLQVVLDGQLGPRGDGYAVGDEMSADDAALYHAPQLQALAAGGAQMATAMTMTYAAEAIGVARAAAAVGVPVVLSFTVEVDGTLPSGQGLAEAVTEVDAATDATPVYYMVNCAHPVHMAPALAGGAWMDRVKGIRANASRHSHAELDEAVQLDRGDTGDLADGYRQLAAVLPDLRVVGGCCGTDHEHVAAVAAAVLSA